MRDADTIFRAEIERRTGARWALRLAAAEDSAFLMDLFAQVSNESVKRLGGSASPCSEGPLLELQVQAQAQAHRAAYPLALHYIVESRGGSPIGRMLIDWPPQPRPSRLIDIAIAPSGRAGAIGLHALRAWVATCDRLGLDASLDVMPFNPARRVYRRLGFIETDPAAFPLHMQRAAREVLHAGSRSSTRPRPELKPHCQPPPSER